MNIPKRFTFPLLGLCLALSGCGSKDAGRTMNDQKKDGKLTVMTTIYPLEDFTKKIGGHHVEVKSIYPPNVDAHSFEPSTKDMIALAESDLFIYTGIGAEGFAEKAAEALKKEDVEILKAAKGIELIEFTHSEHHEEAHAHEEEHTHSHEHEHEHEHESDSESHSEEGHHHGDLNPHVWLDPILSIDLAKSIKTSLSDLMPEHAEEFETNFNQLKNNLEELDLAYKQTVQDAKTKHLLVSHAAYGYWEQRYGVKEIPISGLSPSQEPTQKQLQNIITASTEHGIRYVIFEQNVSSKVADVIKKEMGAESLTLHNLESLTKEDIQRKEDYFSIMRKNLATLKTALNH